LFLSKEGKKKTGSGGPGPKENPGEKGANKKKKRGGGSELRSSAKKKRRDRLKAFLSSLLAAR